MKCKKCDQLCSLEPNQFFYQGERSPGWVCHECNNLWESDDYSMVKLAELVNKKNTRIRDESCATCEWYCSGTCRRNPPQLITIDDEACTESPWVKEDHWCGEYSPSKHNCIQCGTLVYRTLDFPKCRSCAISEFRKYSDQVGDKIDKLLGINNIKVDIKK